MTDKNGAWAAVVAALSLMLAGCSDSEDRAPVTVTVTEAETPTAEGLGGDETEAAVTVEAEETTVVPRTSGSMDAEQIARGDYSSVEGTWSSPEGGTLDISGTGIVWRTDDAGPFAEVAGLELTQSGQSARPAQVLEEAGGTVLAWQWDEQGWNHGTALGFYPAHVDSPTILGAPIPSGSGADRILALPGLATGRTLPSDLTLYLMEREGPSTTTVEDPAGGAGSGCQPPVEGAYPCAGGPLPDEAHEVTSVINAYGTKTATLISPSGNMGCDIRVDGAAAPTLACEARSWMVDGPPVEPVGGNPEIGRPILSFGDGSEEPVFGGAKGDGFCFRKGACASESNVVVEPQVVDYGSVVHYAGFACASEEMGLTCWSVESGHGAFFNRDTISTF